MSSKGRMKLWFLPTSKTHAFEIGIYPNKKVSVRRIKYRINKEGIVQTVKVENHWRTLLEVVK